MLSLGLAILKQRLEELGQVVDWRPPHQGLLQSPHLRNGFTPPAKKAWTWSCPSQYARTVLSF